MSPNPDRGSMAVFVFAVAVAMGACVAILFLLDAVGEAPVGQVFIGMLQ